MKDLKIKTRRRFLEMVGSIALGIALSTPLNILARKNKFEIKEDKEGPWTIQILTRDQMGVLETSLIEIDPNMNLREVADDFTKLGFRITVASTPIEKIVPLDDGGVALLKKETVDHYGEDLIRKLGSGISKEQR